MASTNFLRVASAAAACAALAAACSNLLVSPGASADGSSMLAYNSDDVSLFGSLDLRLAADHAPGSTRAVWDWDGQYYTGEIPQVPHTYNVVGNSNEWGVSAGGRSERRSRGAAAAVGAAERAREAPRTPSPGPHCRCRRARARAHRRRDTPDRPPTEIRRL